MQTHLGSGVDLQSTTEYEHITVKSENTTNRTVFGTDKTTDTIHWGALGRRNIVKMLNFHSEATIEIGVL